MLYKTCRVTKIKTTFKLKINNKTRIKLKNKIYWTKKIDSMATQNIKNPNLNDLMTGQ